MLRSFELVLYLALGKLEGNGAPVRAETDRGILEYPIADPLDVRFVVNASRFDRGFAGGLIKGFLVEDLTRYAETSRTAGKLRSYGNE